MLYDENNIFAKIIRKEIQTEIIEETNDSIAFYDHAPKAPKHILVVPKGAYISFDDFSQNASEAEIVDFIRLVGKLARDAGVKDTGYRLIANHGLDANQEVPHFHIHILAGKPLGPMLSA